MHYQRLLREKERERARTRIFNKSEIFSVCVKGMGSMAGRMHENFKDALPEKAKVKRPAEVRRYREEDEMWG